MCWKCGTPIASDEVLSHSAICSICGEYLHSCKNCTFYEPGAHYDCHETIDISVSDKETANFCEYFSPCRMFNKQKHRVLSDDVQKARNAFEQLFSN